MTAPLCLRITLHGRLSDRLTAAFSGLRAFRRPGHTDLTGVVADQAQLHGVLARVRDLGLTIDSVTVDRVAERGPGRRAETSNRLGFPP